MVCCLCICICIPPPPTVVVDQSARLTRSSLRTGFPPASPPPPSPACAARRRGAGAGSCWRVGGRTPGARGGGSALGAGGWGLVAGWASRRRIQIL